ncbi:MAG TPA: PilZ domain-containing protein [Allosphingosinicella sp.]|jgi:hypothetical protein
MAATAKLNGATTMASRWRRRRMCVLICEHPSPAALRDVSAAGAFLETNARPPLGSQVELHHPEAGAISGEVRSLADDGIGIRFICGEHSVAFALAAIASDMSRPAA